MVRTREQRTYAKISSILEAMNSMFHLDRNKVQAANLNLYFN